MNKEMKKQMANEMMKILCEKKPGTKLKCDNIDKVLFKGHMILYVQEEKLYYINELYGTIFILDGISDVYDIWIRSPYVIVKTTKGEEKIYSLPQHKFIDALETFIKYGDIDKHIKNDNIKYLITLPTSNTEVEYIITQDNKLVGRVGNNIIDLNHKISFDTNKNNIRILELKDSILIKFIKENKVISICGIIVKINHTINNKPYVRYDGNVNLIPSRLHRMFDNEIKEIRPILNHYIGNKMIDSDEYVNYEKIAKKVIKKYVLKYLR